MFNFFRRPEPEPQELSYVVARLSNDPVITENYRRAAYTLSTMGYNVTASTPTLSPEDAATYSCAVEVAVKEEPLLAGNLLKRIESMAGDYDRWQDDKLPDMSADFDLGYDLPDMSADLDYRLPEMSADLDFDYEPMLDMSDDPLMNEPLPDMDDFEEYDIEAEFERVEAGFKAVEYQWLLWEYQAFPSAGLRDKLVSMARSIHPYPLDPNHPVYR